LTFTTQSGSVYEIDGMKIRRKTGTAPPTDRQGDDWKTFVNISEVQVGLPVWIYWDPETTPLLPESNGVGTPMTVTSRVAAIL